MGRRPPTPQIVQRLGDKGVTPHFLPAESLCTYVIPINQIRVTTGPISLLAPIRR